MSLRTFVTAVWLIVTASVIGGLILSGSPGQIRAARLDGQRIYDLSRISAGIDEFFAARDRLPVSLEELQAERNLAIPSIHGPDGTPYTYRIIEDRSYELCAVFETDGSRGPVPGSLSYSRQRLVRRVFWNHPAGRHCFSLEAQKILTGRPGTF